jgi:hypothetical protein
MEKHKERLNFYKNQKLDFKKVLDIGAFEGSWTKMFKEIFPQSKILMIEANSDKEDFLKLVGEYKIALLGSNDGQEVDYFKCKNSELKRILYLKKILNINLVRRELFRDLLHY